MHKKALLQAAFILHRRIYRETSLLLELLTRDYGRVTVLAKGVRKVSSPFTGILQSFIPLWVSWTGRTELMLLTHAEAEKGCPPLQANYLISGLYINELLMALLHPWDAYTRLYTYYANLMDAFYQHTLEIAALLRSFEKCLLEELGYGLFPHSDQVLKTLFSPQQYYHFIPEQGFVSPSLPVTPTSDHRLPETVFLGRDLLAIAKEEWHTPTILSKAKRLMRLALRARLGYKKLYSDQLWMAHPKSSLVLITPTIT